MWTSMGQKRVIKRSLINKQYQQHHEFFFPPRTKKKDNVRSEHQRNPREFVKNNGVQRWPSGALGEHSFLALNQFR